MSQIEGDAEWSISFVVVVAKLFNAEAGENEDRMYTSRQASPHVGHTITDKNSVA